jgi:hypothetical protein
VSEADRAQLRAVLGFPAPVETAAALERTPPRHDERVPVVAEEVDSQDLAGRLDQLTERVGTLTGLVENVFDRVSLLSVSPSGESTGALPAPMPMPMPMPQDGGQRFDRLIAQVSSLGALIEELFDRLGPSSEPAPLTANELADIAARMVRLIEARLETHSERLEQVIADLATRGNAVAVAEGGANLALVNDRLSMIGRAVLDVQKALAEQVHSPLEYDETAIMAHLDRWFEETNSRLAQDIEHVRRDIYKFDQAVIEVKESVARLPDQVAMQQPAARLDVAILQQLETRLEELGVQLAQKFEDELGARIQRFEALSQAMMVLVGEPVDTLIDKVTQLAIEREPTIRASESIKAIEEAQVLIASSLSALRQDGLEREALLRHNLEKLRRPSD